MNEPIKNEAMTLSPLAVKVNERLRVLCINKQMLAVQYHCIWYLPDMSDLQTRRSTHTQPTGTTRWCS